MDILDLMFENLVIYIWMDCTDATDVGRDGAVLLKVEDVDRAKEFTEYISDKRGAESFEDFKNLLRNDDIEFHDVSDSIDIFEFEPDAGE